MRIDSMILEPNMHYVQKLENILSDIREVSQAAPYLLRNTLFEYYLFSYVQTACSQLVERYVAHLKLLRLTPDEIIDRVKRGCPEVSVLKGSLQITVPAPVTLESAKGVPAICTILEEHKREILQMFSKILGSAGFCIEFNSVHQTDCEFKFNYKLFPK